MMRHKAVSLFVQVSQNRGLRLCVRVVIRQHGDASPLVVLSARDKYEKQVPELQ